MDIQHRFALIAGTLMLALVSFGNPINAQSTQSIASPMANGNLSLALALYQNTASTATGNFVYSPYSILEALALTDAGAQGNTDSQIRHVLASGLSQSDLPAAMLAVRTDLLARGNYGNVSATRMPTQSPSEPAPRTLRIANALWGEQTFTFSKPFTDLANINYGGALRLVDFINAPDPSRQAINNLVAQNTDNYIKDIIPPNMVNSAARLVLVNAIYFNSSWAYHPDPRDTKNAPFTLLYNTQPPIQVPMMLMSLDSSYLNYFKGHNYQAVEIPYADNFGTMLIVLPDEGQYTSVEKSLDVNLFNTIIDGLKSQEVNVTMPRFTFDSSLDLKASMQALGLTDAFDSNAADFSGMGPRGLYIQAILHKALIQVDENGTVAAAATGNINAIQGFTGSPIQLDINRPFIFAIRDPQTGLILFMGRVLNPLSQ